MSEELEVRKPRSISIPDADIQDVLKWKLIQYQEQNIPIDVLSDYISKGLDEVEAKKAQLKAYKTMIDSEIKDLEAHSTKVKVECAKFMSENGVDKLNGIEVSSITITKEKPQTQEETIKEEFICDLSKKEINDFLVTQNLGSYKRTPTTKIVPKVEAMIKINKRRVKKDK